MSKKLTSILAPHNTALFCEDETEIERLAADFRAEHSPVGPTEDYLVEQLARAAWRTRRYGRVELGLLDFQTAQAAGRLQCERTQDRARTDPELHHNNTLLLGAAFHEDCDKNRRAQERLARLQDAAERSFLRCLKALHGEQDRRRKAQAQPQPSSSQPASVGTAAQAAGGRSNVVVLAPAAKSSAPRYSPRPIRRQPRSSPPIESAWSEKSDYSDALPPAG